MIKTVLGEMTYSIGWKNTREISLFHCNYTITVKLQAYKEESNLPIEQLRSCSMYVDHEEEMITSIEKLMNDFSSNFSDRFIPKTLLFKKSGAIALLCDDVNNPDEGIAICLFPEKCVMSQDDYL